MGLEPPFIKLETSSLVTRPLSPVPLTILISTPWLFAKALVAGVDTAFEPEWAT